MIFKTIESWASNLGYVVEKKETYDGYIWYKENDLNFNYSKDSSDTIDQILEEIRKKYVGG